MDRLYIGTRFLCPSNYSPHSPIAGIYNRKPRFNIVNYTLQVPSSIPLNQIQQPENLTSFPPIRLSSFLLNLNPCLYLPPSVPQSKKSIHSIPLNKIPPVSR